MCVLDKQRNGNLRLLPPGCNGRNCLQNGFVFRYLCLFCLHFCEVFKWFEQFKHYVHVPSLFLKTGDCRSMYHISPLLPFIGNVNSVALSLKYVGMKVTEN